MTDNLLTDCCGTTCDKADIQNKINELENENTRLQVELDTHDLELRKQKELIAKKAYFAGANAGANQMINNQPIRKQWLDFVVTEL